MVASSFNVIVSITYSLITKNRGDFRKTGTLRANTGGNGVKVGNIQGMEGFCGDEKEEVTGFFFREEGR